MSDTTINIIFMLIGIFTYCGVHFEWSFFFKSRKAKRLVNIFGMKTTKIIYIIIAVALFSISLLNILGIIDIPLKLGRRH